MRRLTTILRRCFVDLQNLAFDLAADEIANVRRSANIHLAGRQEHVDADVDEQAALDLAADDAFDDVAFLVLGENGFPFLLAFRLAVGEADGAEFVFDGFQQHFDLVADFGQHEFAGDFVLEFFGADVAFGLVADVNEQFIADEAEHPAANDLI